jgi:asparagine synthase (glutamine-hydrolysing)
MCGIAGLTFDLASKERAAQESVRMLDVLSHRGPDDSGWLVFSGGKVQSGRDVQVLSDLVLQSRTGPGVVLLHRRLAILDLSPLGWQPMATSDGRFQIVFNGEIYNFLEVRSELQALGDHFHTQSDTEVLLAAFQRWGSEMLPRLVGMFALVILDVLKQKLFFARDAFGIKPLYHASWSGGVVFASEPKAILGLPGVSRKVNPQRLFEYLRFGRSDYGAQTLFSDIRQVPAAHALELDITANVVPEAQSYWSINPELRSDLGFDAAAKHLQDLFLESVDLHMRSDVPVGAALSGGIDSSAIVMSMRTVNPSAEIHAFSFVADDPQVSEESFVDLVGARAKAKIHKIRLDEHDVSRDLNDLVSLQDEPFGSTSIYAQFQVFKLAQQNGIKVVLDGQGADEMLAGYEPFLGARLASLVRSGNLTGAFALSQHFRKLPGRKWAAKWAVPYLIPDVFQGALRNVVRLELMPTWFNSDWFVKSEVKIEPTRSSSQAKGDFLHLELNRSIRETSLPQLLRYEDRNSMVHSVESRVPFLTPKLAEFVLSLPESFLIDDHGTSKAVFRQAMRGVVPDEVLDRKDKIGFATPERRWLNHLRPMAEQTFELAQQIQLPVFNLQRLRQEWLDVLENRRPFDFRIWRCLNLILWASRFEVDFS